MQWLSNRWLIALGILWVSGVSVGLWMLADYESTPGAAAVAPGRWPVDSRIERVPGRATLIMLAHPHCPCTRASVGELALLMARAQGLVSAYVLFLAPKGFADDWHQTDLWDSATAIPDVQAMEDDDGQEALRFHAATSGQTLLYDAEGGLMFSGGITDARGHSGDNTGRQAILSLLTTGVADQTQTPVFGCAMRSESTVGDEGDLVCRQ